LQKTAMTAEINCVRNNLHNEKRQEIFLLIFKRFRKSNKFVWTSYRNVSHFRK